MTPKELKRTHGYFTGSPTYNFPLDCEGLENMQENESLLSALGNIGGGQYVLSPPTTDKGGYIFLSTDKEPQGELLYIEAKKNSNSQWFYVHTEDVDIKAQEILFNKAYQRRWLKWDTTGQKQYQQYQYNTFEVLQTNKQLTERCNNINTDISNLAKFVSGMILMWSGSIDKIPAGWALCNGQVTTTGIKTPDLQGRFIVGAGQAYRNPQNADAEAYRETLLPNYAVGAIGGKNKYAQNEAEIFEHSHSISPNPHSHSYQLSDTGNENSRPETGTGNIGRANTNDTALTIENTGSSSPHENRPQYYALAYIIKL